MARIQELRELWRITVSDKRNYIIQEAERQNYDLNLTTKKRSERITVMDGRT